METIIYPRRDLTPAWNINDASDAGVPQGVVTPADISRCTDINIMALDEVQAGECIFGTGQTCVAEGEYKVVFFNAHNSVVIKWTITSGTATILVDGTGHPVDNEESVVVSSTGDADSTFELTCVVTDDLGATTSSSQTFTHNRALQA